MLHDSTAPTATPTLSASIDCYTDRLLTDGWCIIPDAMPAARVRALDDDLSVAFEETPYCEGGFYGRHTKRFGRLLARSAQAADFVQHGLILGVSERVLKPWCDTIQLNLTQAVSIDPGALPQLPHRDQDMWRGETGSVEYLVNVMWPFTDYRADNGATLIWPGSHGRKALDVDSSNAPIVAEMRPGAALLFLGWTLHGAGGNVSQDVRRGMIVSYCLGWLKPYENQWLAYPPEVARTFSADLAALAGYRQHRPNLGNYEGRCPSILLGDPIEQPLGAIDALRPDQTALIDDFVENQRRAL